MEDLPIHEFYSKTLGSSEWSMAGYKPPSTCLLDSRDVGLGKDRRKPFTDEISNQFKHTDPTQYSDTLEVSEKKLWLQHCISFTKAKRETLTAKAMRKSKSTPGPGQYFKEENLKKQINAIALGRFK